MRDQERLTFFRPSAELEELDYVTMFKAKKNKLADHEVFNSETFQGLFEFPLSTSTLNSDAVSLGAFAPVVPGEIFHSILKYF